MARKTSSRTRPSKAGDKAAPIEDAGIVAETPAEAPETAPAEQTFVTDPEAQMPGAAKPAVPEAEGIDPEVPPPGPVLSEPPVADPEPPVETLVEPVPTAADPADTGPAPEDAAAPDPARPEPAAAAPKPLPPAPPPPPPSGSNAMPLVSGGFAAAVLGALVVLIFLPNGWRGAAPDAALAQRVQALESRAANAPTGGTVDLTPLEDRIAALETRVPDAAPAVDLQPLETRIAALESAAPADVSAEVEALSARIDTLESGIDARIIGAVASAMAEARAAIDARADTLDAREEDVAAAQQRIAERAALAELVGAAESGAPAPGALATLSSPPEALAPMAEGLPTLAALQTDFAPAARAALAADPVAPGASLGERVADFLRAQTGARSLAPREGDDTDAILSRAEARVRAGDLPGALTELDTLSGAPAAAMADWRARAETRLAALAALSDLQAQLDHGE